jgi:hypothetical protein
MYVARSLRAKLFPDVASAPPTTSAAIDAKATTAIDARARPKASVTRLMTPRAGVLIVPYRVVYVRRRCGSVALAEPHKATRLADAANNSTAGSTAKAGVPHLAPIVVPMEQLIRVFSEEARQGDGQWQRRQVPTGLDRVDRLARNLHRTRQVLLSEALVSPELSNDVPH